MPSNGSCHFFLSKKNHSNWPNMLWLQSKSGKGSSKGIFCWNYFYRFYVWLVIRSMHYPGKFCPENLYYACLVITLPNTLTCLTYKIIQKSYYHAPWTARPTSFIWTHMHDRKDKLSFLVNIYFIFIQIESAEGEFFKMQPEQRKVSINSYGFSPKTGEINAIPVGVLIN